MQKESLRTRGSEGYYSRYFAGGFALWRCRNSIRRYSTAPKHEFRSQFPLFPLYCRYSSIRGLNLCSELRLYLLPAVRNRPKTGTHLELSAEFHFGTRKSWDGNRLSGSKSLTSGNAKRFRATEFTPGSTPPNTPRVLPGSEFSLLESKCFEPGKQYLSPSDRVHVE